ncbi:MAG: SDR family NAD(P)-dependent oxidoreductase [Pseudomonadota bacterium]
MAKTILVTGATDGIGLLTAQNLAAQGHVVLLHGRSEEKLASAAGTVRGTTRRYRADLSDLAAVAAMAAQIQADHDRLDVLINNAGVLKAPQPRLENGLDIRFVVNALAPYLLTQRLLPLIPADGRIVNVSSAAQSPVDLDAIQGRGRLDDMSAYAQSKLAITIWTRAMSARHPEGPVVVAVNPGSLLASKMVKQGFGIAGNDLAIGADILCDAALGARFATASGAYFDNDTARFGDPHPAALDPGHTAAVMALLDQLVPPPVADTRQPRSD